MGIALRSATICLLFFATAEAFEVNTLPTGEFASGEIAELEFTSEFSDDNPISEDSVTTDDSVTTPDDLTFHANALETNSSAVETTRASTETHVTSETQPIDQPHSSQVGSSQPIEGHAITILNHPLQTDLHPIPANQPVEYPRGVQYSLDDSLTQPYIPADANCACAPSGPLMSVAVDVLLLGRHEPVEGGFLFDSVTFEPLLDLNELTDGVEPGLRLSVIAFEDDIWATEFTFFGLGTINERIHTENANPIVFPIFGGVPANPQNAVDIKYTSQFHGAEINRRRRLSPRITGLLGFRFIELREEFDISDALGVFESLSDNDLYGIQIGGEFMVKKWGCTDIVGTIKSGIYYNNADVQGIAINPATGGPMRFLDDEDHLAHVSEVSLGLAIPMGPQGTFRIGYEFIYLDGVGLAPNQNETFSIFTGQGSLNTSEVWYHGGYLGVEIFW